MPTKSDKRSINISHVGGNVSGNLISAGDLQATQVRTSSSVDQAPAASSQPDVREMLDEIVAELIAVSQREEDLRKIAPNAAHQLQGAMHLIAGMQASLTADQADKDELIQSAKSAEEVVGGVLKKGRALIDNASQIGDSATKLLVSIESVATKIAKLAAWIPQMLV
jgi:hypothetical protein